MSLTANELSVVNKCMEKYAVLYQEILDELTDHIITAIEFARANGDNRNIETVFNEIIEVHFGGVKGIARLTYKYVLAYNRKIRKTMIANFKHYLNWQVMLLTVVLLLVGFYLPRTLTISLILLFVLAALAAIPSFYAMFKMPKPKRKTKSQFLLRSFVVARTRDLSLILNLNVVVIGFFAKRWHISFLIPWNYPPVVLMALICFFALYGLSTIRLCKQEIKLDKV